MITQNVRIPRWRAVVLCLGGVIAMTKPLTGGVSLYRSTLPAPVTNYSSLYGWVEERGPYNANERWRAEQRLRVIGYPREHFSEGEIQEAAAVVRSLGLGEVRRRRVEEKERAERALGDRAVAVVMTGLGAGGIVFYLWLGYTLLHEADPNGASQRRAGWLGKPRRHGRIVFGGQGGQQGTDLTTLHRGSVAAGDCVFTGARYCMYPWSRSSPAPVTTSATSSPASRH
jgi:hypothetical protein